MQRVDHPDPAAANEQALHDLENGATGLTIVCKGSVNANGYGLDSSLETLERVLDGIYLDAGVAIDFNVSVETRDAAKNFAALVKKRGIAPETRRACAAALNPLGHMAATGSTVRAVERARALSSPGWCRTSPARLSRAVRGRGRARDPQCRRLGGAGACLRARQRGHLSARARSVGRRRSMRRARMIYFRLAADADQFLTIAKFRAIRKLWARVEQACGLAPAPAFVAAETAWRMMTRRDPYVNILRSTVAVFAAGLGGADAITVLPFTAAIGLPDALRAPRRAQHAARPAGGVEPREGQRPGRGLRRHRGSDAAALRAPRGRCSRRSRRPAARRRRSKQGLIQEQGRGDPRRAREECRAAQAMR